MSGRRGGVWCKVAQRRRTLSPIAILDSYLRLSRPQATRKQAMREPNIAEAWQTGRQSRR